MQCVCLSPVAILVQRCRIERGKNHTCDKNELRRIVHYRPPCPVQFDHSRVNGPTTFLALLLDMRILSIGLNRNDRSNAIYQTAADLLTGMAGARILALRQIIYHTLQSALAVCRRGTDAYKYLSMDLALTNRLVAVTGASRGIGRAIALAFAREGCRLHLVAKMLGGLEALRDEICRTYNVGVEIYQADISKADAASAIFNGCPDADVLINNAGGIIRGDLLNIDEAQWREAWEPKVFGYINLTRHYYRRMHERGRGVIINVIGLGAEKVDYDYAAGSAGNAALAALTRAVGSASLDHGVRIVGVHPGWVETDRTLSLLLNLSIRQFGDAERWQDVLNSWQVRGLIKPAEIADVVTFLASDRASAICGVNVNIDRGSGARSYPRTGST